jgi:hypothetical protein
MITNNLYYSNTQNFETSDREQLITSDLQNFLLPYNTPISLILGKTYKEDLTFSYQNSFALKGISGFSESNSIYAKITSYLDTVCNLKAMIPIASVINNYLQTQFVLKATSKIASIITSTLNTVLDFKAIKKIAMVSHSYLADLQYKLLSQMDASTLGSLDSSNLGNLDASDSVNFLIGKTMAGNITSYLDTIIDLTMETMHLLSDFDSDNLSVMDSQTLGQLDAS